MITITWRDPLNRTGFRWPKTLISEPVVFEKPVALQGLCLKDKSGASIPFQLTNVEKTQDGICAATLHFLSDLAEGEEKHYCLLTDCESCDPVPEMPESMFKVEFQQEANQIKITAMQHSMTFTLPFADIHYRTVRDGAVFTDFEINCSEKQKTYTLQIRAIRDLPFMEIRETMSGFENDDNTSAALCFSDFSFRSRYSWSRSIEKIDDYLRENGKLPITLMPYENYVPWFQSKYIAFSDAALSAGIFIRDNEEWKEETYPIWSSNRSFGIHFFYQNDQLSASFPMKNGTRSTALAVFPGNDPTQIRRLWTWYAFLNLNKVRQWKLEWEEPQEQYPRFFAPTFGQPWPSESWFCKKGEYLNGDKMDAVIDGQSPSVHNICASDSEGTGPVENREFAVWTAVFDMTALQMTRAQFDRAKAFFAFMAYATQDENYMPTKNLLAGHPNFLADTAAVSGFFAAMFPHHPQAEQFRAYFNKTVKANLNYHIRPDVAAYESIGGRETENTGCYSMAMLRPYVNVCSLFAKCGYPIPLNCKNGAKWLNWIISTLSAPVDGRRIIPQQGAHCRRSEIPYVVNQFAQFLEADYPELAKNTYAMCEGAELIAFEVDTPADDPYWSLFERRTYDSVSLPSVKFTGYGCVFREAVGTPDEISLHVQQLDRGPNYRWGTFENTGNGGIFYYAAGKRYSFVAPEDTGDRNLGAEEGSCNFSVLCGHTYRNIGFHDLTEPMYDFPLIKQTKLLAGAEISAFYKYRRVSLVGKDYAVFYDAVTHMRAFSRFNWSVNACEDYPQIWQLRPSSAPVYPERLAAAFVTGNGDANSLPESLQSKSVYFEGNGNFLTIVSHRKDMAAIRTSFGAEVTLPERRDLIFEDQAKICYQENGLAFEGYSAIISMGNECSICGAMTEGRKIAVNGFRAELNGKAGLFFCKRPEKVAWQGELHASETCQINICGQARTVDAGHYTWTLETELQFVRKPDHKYDDNTGFVRDTRRHEFGFNGYDFDDLGEILTYPK